MTIARRHPPWIKVRAPGGGDYAATRATVRDLGLHTVCEEAHCPNLAECWGHRTATFMLMGDVCTRNCGYCAVAHGRPGPLDAGEPLRVAEGAARLGLRHIVITSVDRDDLVDGGAAHFAATARAVRERLPSCTIEVLTPDFQGDFPSAHAVVDSPIDVFNHNTETVPRLYKRARPGGRYDRTLGLLAEAKDRRGSLLTKTGLMLGLGETRDEIEGVLRDLVGVGCDILTLGQYLQPTRAHLPVDRYISPDEFRDLGGFARGMGFRHVESGPLVRSSYHAWEHVESQPRTSV
jgi:lipoic acid synthetase